MAHQQVKEALALIFRGIGLLQRNFSTRQFTIDGRLVGDLGEIIAAAEFDIILDYRSRSGHDAKTSDGRDVQIKATFKESLTFGTIPELYLGIKLFQDGRHETIFNGPGRVIFDAFAHRKHIGSRLLSFPITRLRKLSEPLKDEERVPLRAK